MSNGVDIRDMASLTGREVVELNFIRDSSLYSFRKHHRQGMRSHIFEVLAVRDLLKEREGEVVDGIRRYPRAVPRFMLRILRARFTSIEQIMSEISKYTLVLKFLGAELIAISNEFIVDYRGTGKSEIVLCGFQEYIQGAILDPWGLAGKDPLDTFFQSRFPGGKADKKRTATSLESLAAFVGRMRKMITESGYVTDLAGNGNLIITATGAVKLVDINNIVKVSRDDTIPLDDKGYPSCDKSIEVLFILEEKILKSRNLLTDPLYSHFLSTERKKRADSLERQFFENLPE